MMKKTEKIHKTTTKESPEDKCARLEAEVELLKIQLKWYEEQNRLNKQRLYGKSSEQISSDQTSLFNEAETEADNQIKEPTIEEVTYKRRKKGTHGGQMLKDFPTEVIEYKLPDGEATCPTCQQEMHVMTKEVRREIKVVPAKVTVVEHVCYVYACRSCEKNELTTPIIKADAPNPVIPGGFASPSALAFVIDQKYNQALPLYRQEQLWKNNGVELSRQTLSNWILTGTEQWLLPVYNQLHQHLLEESVLHADETTLQVLNEQGRKATSKSYMWMFATGKDGPAIFLYDYQTTRANKHPKNFLKGFEGYLHTDGYSGYHDLPEVKLVGCFAHARRKFTDSLKALPKDATKSVTVAQEGLNYCNQLFKIEKELVDETPEVRYIKRQEQSKPVLEAFLEWLEIKKNQVLPKSSLGQAIKYCLNQWSKLVVFLEDGRLEISNNRAERAIKPFVIGRKNWLFSKTPKGAKASAIAYSIVETAKANGLSPFHYLEYLFEKAPNIDLTSPKELEQLMPWSKDLPEACRSKKN